MTRWLKASQDDLPGMRKSYSIDMLRRCPVFGFINKYRNSLFKVDPEKDSHKNLFNKLCDNFVAYLNKNEIVSYDILNKIEAVTLEEAFHNFYEQFKYKNTFMVVKLELQENHETVEEGQKYIVALSDKVTFYDDYKKCLESTVKAMHYMLVNKER